ncbi:MAG: hypothetical protein K2X87_09320 [Gemmataceae bacterium]|nr:hypothetical protein [Gemmataceae bacterium]
MSAEPLSVADRKTRRRRNQHFLRWVKENCCCKRCGARPPVPHLTFHHARERRFGSPCINTLCHKSPGLFIEELLKGEFLCKPCHEKAHQEGDGTI